MVADKMKVKLFKGCVISNRLPFLEKSARLVLNKLGFTLEDAPFTCCPDPIGISAISEKAWITLAARNLVLGERDDTEIISICNGCTETLTLANHFLKTDKEVLTETNAILEKKGYKYTKKAKVSHFVKTLVEDVGVQRIKDIINATWSKSDGKSNPIQGIKIASHPGCHYNKPSSILKWDNPEDPKYLEELILAIGAVPVKYDEKTLCCGSGVIRTREDIGFEMARKKYQSIVDAGAQIITTNCPSCFQTLESNQNQVNKKFGKEYSFPVFYITELIALAFGYTVEEIGIKFHSVKKNIGFI